MFKKKFLVGTVAVLLALCLAACGGGNGPKVIGRTSDKEVGNYEGSKGDIMRTVFFDFTVDEVNFVQQYETVTAAEGNVLIDAVITVKNTFGEELPMFASDFQIQWGEGDEDYGYQDETLVSETLMPEEWPLGKDETKTYHVLYEVPANSAEYSISYLEYYDDETEGDVFFVYFKQGDSASAKV